MKKLLNDLKGPADRRSFMKKGLAAAGAATVGGGLLGRGVSAFGQERAGAGSSVDGPVAPGTASPSPTHAKTNLSTGKLAGNVISDDPPTIAVTIPPASPAPKSKSPV